MDTVRADYTGCCGSPDVKTPNIDKTASSGVMFTRTVAPSQCTNPSHASMFTGLYPTRHQVLDNRTPLTNEAKTLAEIFKENWIKKSSRNRLSSQKRKQLDPKTAEALKSLGYLE